MNIFRGKKPKRGHRAEMARREQLRGRRGGGDNPLSDLVREEQRTGTPSARRQTKRDGKIGGITFVHVGFLLAGLVLGVGLLLGGSALMKWRHALDLRQVELRAAKAEAQAQTPPSSRATPPPMPRPAVTAAATPEEAVRIMLKAALAGDAATAYGQWEIEPNEIATVYSGQQLTVKELVAALRSLEGEGDLSAYRFRTEPQGADRAMVYQERNGPIVAKFSVHRTGGAWKIRFVSRP